MRTLQLIEEHEGIDQQALDDYAKLFKQPLPDSHVQALAALFHWSLPENLGEGEDGALLF
jgi:beta-glucosidase/6-phospho-beta-glucosidase/beta-galactosidase